MNDSDRRRAKLGVLLGLLVAVMLGFGLLLFRSASTPMIVLMIIVIVAITAFAVLNLNQQSAFKRKRETDIYALIDRMVEDLDADELDYLRRRLEAREQDIANRLPEDLADALDQRDEDRQAGRR